MPKRNITWYVVSLTALFVAAFLAGFLAPVPGKMDLFGELTVKPEGHALALQALAAIDDTDETKDLPKFAPYPYPERKKGSGGIA
jgi:hypothetical protein